jgi:tetratricopeptide (TPR) repeat protein
MTMSDTPKNADHLARCEQLLRAAEAFEQATDWDNAVVKYRELNALDHLYKGAEAKLLYALQERDSTRLYREGQAHFTAERYAEARDAFRKAKSRSGFYKDTNELIKECERRLAGSTVTTITPSATTRKGCLGVLLFLH